MKAARILVTRSEPGASETAERLLAAGHVPIVEPVFAVEPIEAAIPQFDALAFTSANGVREFAKRTARRDAAVFCVGARTAEAARTAGFAKVVSADGDVGDLAALILEQSPAAERVLHAGNEETRGDLVGQLRAKGRIAAFVAIYRAAPVALPGPALAAHLAGSAAFDAALVHSPRGAAILAGFADAAPGRAPLDIAAISPAAAAPLQGLARRVALAARPDEAALLVALAGLVF